MRVYSDLKAASFEGLSSDPSAGTQGRFWLNTTSGKLQFDDGTNIRSILRNDQNLIFGNSGTASSNIRANRAGTSVLQFVTGNDVTAEGSLSTALAQLSFKFETYTDAGKPSAGSAGRIIYVSDLATFLGDNGTSYSPLGGGGAGGSLKWVESTGAAPQLLNEGNVEVHTYSLVDAGVQALYAMVRVPTSYVAGRQIKLKIPVYSIDASGTFLIQSVATLIRTGTDAYTSTANQRTSTNTAITASGANQNIPQSVELDLTSATGQINGVAVAAGHYIVVKLQRGTDTATSDVRALTYASEVTLT